MPEHDVFLCHASTDKPAVEHIAERLRGEDIEPFLDKWNLIPGDPIQTDLQQALNDSRCCAVFIGPGESGPWQNKEMQVALQRQTRDAGFRVIPVFLPGAPPIDELTVQHGFLMLNLGVDFHNGLDDKDALQQLMAGIHGRPHRTRAPRRRSGEPGQLTVELRLEGDRLTRRYLGPYGKLVADRRDSWATFQHEFRGWCGIGAGAVGDDRLGDAMFDLLFRDQRGRFHQDVLAEIFPSDRTRLNPNRHPVKLRLHLNDQALTNLPWSCLSWERMSLAAMDWTLELAAPGNSTDWPERHIRLYTPCPVLIIAPQQDRLGSDGHAKAMEYKFRDLWLGAEIRVATNQAEIIDTVRDRTPRIVYFHGMAQQTNDAFSLSLDDGNLDLAALNELWQQSPPQILFLNLVEEDRLDPNWAVRSIAGDIPLLITQHWPLDDIQTARDSVLGWFEDVLTNADPYIDPVAILHHHACCTAIAWTSYGGWKTDTVDKLQLSARRPLAKLLLDRDGQRRQALQAMLELANDQKRRMTCLLGYGGPRDLAGLFGEQIFSYLEQQTMGDNSLVLQKQTLDLPPNKIFDQHALDRQLRRALSLGPRDSLSCVLEQRKPTVPGNPTTVLLLIWRTRDLDTPGLKRSSLEAWLDYCQNILADRCPDGMRLLGCLTLEAPLTRHGGLTQLFDSLGKDTRFRSSLFRLELLDPLHHVDESHLADYLSSSNCHCDEELRAYMPELILKETGGEFEATAKQIDEADSALGWWGLRDRLVAKFGKPAPQSANPQVQEDEDL